MLTKFLPNLTFTSLFVVVIATMSCQAQFQAPYEIASTDMDGNADTLWVLFPDIQALQRSLLLPRGELNDPSKLHVDDSIMLDTTYKLDIRIVKIEKVDSLKYTILCELIHRKNAKLQLNYWWFAGGFWVIEGKTFYSPVACDHLVFSLYDKDTISIGLSYSRNCP